MFRSRPKVVSAYLSRHNYLLVVTSLVIAVLVILVTIHSLYRWIMKAKPGAELSMVQQEAPEQPRPDWRPAAFFPETGRPVTLRLQHKGLPFVGGGHLGRTRYGERTGGGTKGKMAIRTFQKGN